MMRALLALALLATPAAADDLFICEGKSTLTFRHNGREVVIKRPGEMAVSIPRGGSASRFAWWSPFEDSWGCEVAPCAIYWQPAKGPAVIEYMLEDDKVVACKP